MEGAECGVEIQKVLKQAEFQTCFFWNEKFSNLFVSKCSQVGNGRINKGTRSGNFSAIVKSSGMFHIFRVEQASRSCKQWFSRPDCLSGGRWFESGQDRSFQCRTGKNSAGITTQCVKAIVNLVREMKTVILNKNSRSRLAY